MSDANGRILVSDFDGTMTHREFYKLVIERLLPADHPDYWAESLAGRMTHFEAVQAIYGSAKAGEPAFLDLVSRMELEPELKADVEALERGGWQIVVASAGCDWYISRLLAGADVKLEVHANPGRIEDGRLLMELPVDSPYFSRETGVDKVAIVRAAMSRAGTVAYAGDGRPDLPPSLLVPANLRFARGVLAEELTRLGEGFRPYERWSEVARALLELA